MSKELEITTKVCSSQAGVADSNCNDVILKIPQTEALKLQSVAFSSNESQNFSAKNFMNHADSFGFSFGLVLIFYLIAKCVGSLVSVIK